MGADRSADLRNVFDVARDICRHMSSDMLVVNKSTVPVGTAYEVQVIIKNELVRRGVNYKCTVVSNPEFLKEEDGDQFMGVLLNIFAAMRLLLQF